jgi:hypothetical protein
MVEVSSRPQSENPVRVTRRTKRSSSGTPSASRSHSAGSILQLVYLSSGRWMWEQAHEWVPLLILALVPAGRMWGLDRRLAHRGIRRLRGFPF